jgi:hypothetical protein
MKEIMSESKRTPTSNQDGVRESDIDLMFPLKSESEASDQLPVHRIRFYNARQRDRREGAKRLLERINHSL